MRLYQFLKAADAIDDLQRRRMKISRLSDLNDPFELLAADLRNKKVRQAFEATRADLSQKFGVLCFSQGWHNPLMWSHYADRHRGICLGFEVPTEKLTPINYETRRLPEIVQKLLMGSREEQESIMLRLLTTKYRDWKYEDEVRVVAALNMVDTETGYYFADFGDDLRLKAIVLGPRFEGGVRDIVDVCGRSYSGVRVVKARLAFRKFSVVETRGSVVIA